MVLSISWRQRYPERVAETDFKYNNSERGFIINKIGDIFKPSKGKTRKKRWLPQMTRKELWEDLFLYIQYMKELYPQSDGRLCCYCHKPWTYLTRKKRPGAPKHSVRGSQHPTNFAIDRVDAELTYCSGNITFCCSACNDRKHDSRPSDWKNFLRVVKERNDYLE
tara:strand:+ start:94 stop:588 length:495 start_codon:yes stop_codon:yes gene_type:complete